MHRLAPFAMLVVLPLAAVGDPPREITLHATLALDLDADGRIVTIEPADERVRGLRELLIGEVSK